MQFSSRKFASDDHGSVCLVYNLRGVPSRFPVS